MVLKLGFRAFLPTEWRDQIRKLRNLKAFTLRELGVVTLLVVLTVCFEAFGMAMIIPLLDFIDKGRDIGTLSADSRMWQAIQYVYSLAGLPVSLGSLSGTVLALICHDRRRPLSASGYLARQSKTAKSDDPLAEPPRAGLGCDARPARLKTAPANVAQKRYETTHKSQQETDIVRPRSDMGIAERSPLEIRPATEGLVRRHRPYPLQCPGSDGGAPRRRTLGTGRYAGRSAPGLRRDRPARRLPTDGAGAHAGRAAEVVDAFGKQVRDRSRVMRA